MIRINNNNNNNNNRPRTTNPICGSGITKSTENEQVRLIRILKLLYIIILYDQLHFPEDNLKYRSCPSNNPFLFIIQNKSNPQINVQKKHTKSGQSLGKHQIPMSMWCSRRKHKNIFSSEYVYRKRFMTRLHTIIIASSKDVVVGRICGP